MELMVHDETKVRMNVEVEYFEAKGLKRAENGDILEGKLVLKERGHNMVVNTGLNFIRQAISRSVTPMSHIGVGSGSTAADAGDTDLETPIERVALLDYADTATGAVTFRAIFEANQGNGNLREWGIFNAASGGTMGARYVMGASYTKDTTLVVRVSWVFTFADT